MTREQYIEMLIDASFQGVSEMESGFASWCEQHVLIWQKLGHDETWIRQRIETAQITRGLHRQRKEQGLTMLEIRDELRKTYMQMIQNSLMLRENATLTSFALMGIRVTSGNALYAARHDL